MLIISSNNDDIETNKLFYIPFNKIYNFGFKNINIWNYHLNHIIINYGDIK